MRVMLVDDDKFCLSAICQMLRWEGICCDAFDSSSTALNSFAGDLARYDLVITDQQMPGCDGLELARHMREMRPDMPIVLVSGGGMENGQRDNLRRLGIQVQQKPLDLERILAIVDTVAVCRSRARAIV